MKFEKQMLVTAGVCAVLLVIMLVLIKYQLQHLKESGGLKAEVMEIWEGKKE